jgi:aminoglycoside 6'-N-acetyltransferase I
MQEIRIVDLTPENRETIGQTAQLLVQGFGERSPAAWPDLESALGEVRESLQPDRLSRVAIAKDGTVLGWIGGISEYDGRVWELHPLVVRPDCQRQGIGRALVTDFEDYVRERGGITILLGADDEDDATSLSGVDLYTDLWERIASIENRRQHPYEFYQKLGFTIVGVVPDANGWGKPDILMAKRVEKS